MTNREKILKTYLEDFEKGSKGEIDIELLERIVVSLGPSVFTKKSIISDDEGEFEMIKNKFLVEKLGLLDSDLLKETIKKIVSYYSEFSSKKYRAIVYYMLTKEFKKEYVFTEVEVIRDNKNPIINKRNEIDSFFSNFGNEFINSQVDMDIEIKTIIDANFSKLL